MTEEQIKQNADKYADKLYEDGRCTESTAPTIQEIYIAGAYSRDEEIDNLNKIIVSLEYDIEILKNKLQIREDNINLLLYELESINIGKRSTSR